ncbi:MAG: phospholipase [Elusimicrobia bacterium]|nr:phospholipase [Elusimicrobiota bacterium]
MRRAKALSRLLFSAAAVAAAAGSSRAEFKVPGYELVYSYPVESTLAEPDLRSAHEVWPKMIDAAKKTVDIEQFYVVNSTGGFLEPTIQAIERAAKRGVRVRFIMEKLFFKIDPASPASFARIQSMPGVEARAVEWARVFGEGIVHCKFIVVDGKTGYLGSQNFDWRSLEHIHELGVKTDDAGVVSQMQSVFDHDWGISLATAPVKAERAAKGSPDPARRSYLVASPWAVNPAGVEDSESELVRLLGSATAEIRVQVLDYNAQTRSRPPRAYSPIDNALRDAALRGVKVKLLVSHWNTDTHSLPHIKSLAALHNVEIRVATIPDPASWPEHVPFTRVVHSKYMTVDGKTLWLGTSNWAGGYLDNSRNLEVVVNDPALAERAARIHAHLWDSPYSAPLDVSKDYPKPRR